MRREPRTIRVHRANRDGRKFDNGRFYDQQETAKMELPVICQGGDTLEGSLTMPATRILLKRRWRILLTGCLIIGTVPGCRGSRYRCHEQPYEPAGYGVEHYQPSPDYGVPYQSQPPQSRTYEPVPMLGAPDGGQLVPQPEPQPAPAAVPMGPEIKSPRRFPGDDDQESLDLNSAQRPYESRSIREKISGWFNPQNVSHPAPQRKTPARSAEQQLRAPRTAPTPNDRVAERSNHAPAFAPASRRLEVTPTESRTLRPVSRESSWGDSASVPHALPVQRTSIAENPADRGTTGNRFNAPITSHRPVDTQDPLRTLPPWPEGPAGKARAHDYFERIPDSSATQPQPMRVIEPPTLQAPPTNIDADTNVRQTSALSIPRISVCREVRSFDNVDELDRRQLRGGQPVLLYASLKGFQSMPTPSGFRTLTLSTLEIRNAARETVSTHPLGTATDLADAPRGNYYLTHQLRLPADLPAGDYLLELTVTDLIGKQTAKSQLAAHVSGR